MPAGPCMFFRRLEMWRDGRPWIEVGTFAASGSGKTNRIRRISVGCWRGGCLGDGMVKVRRVDDVASVSFGHIQACRQHHGSAGRGVSASRRSDKVHQATRAQRVGFSVWCSSCSLKNIKNREGFAVFRKWLLS
jgi:hypothetical protein